VTLSSSFPSDQPSSSQTGIVTCESNQAVFHVVIETDKFPFETEWELTSFAGVTAETGGPYDLPNSRYTERYCIPSDEAYVFTMKDRYGDGLCCNNGKGSYSAMLDGEELAAGGKFRQRESTNLIPECGVGKEHIVVEVTTDYFGFETSWSMETMSGNTVMSGSNYTSWETSKDSRCFNTSDCYRFTIKDTCKFVRAR
jgi:hypothetical protein